MLPVVRARLLELAASTSAVAPIEASAVMEPAAFKANDASASAGAGAQAGRSGRKIFSLPIAVDGVARSLEFFEGQDAAAAARSFLLDLNLPAEGACATARPVYLFVCVPT